MLQLYFLLILIAQAILGIVTHINQNGLLFEEIKKNKACNIKISFLICLSCTSTDKCKFMEFILNN